MSEHTQIGIDGTEIPWHLATKPDAPSKTQRRKDTQTTTDNMLVGWMRLWDSPLTSQEIHSRLEKLVSITQAAVDASLYRLWKAKQVRRKGHPAGMAVNKCGLDETWRLR